MNVIVKKARKTPAERARMRAARASRIEKFLQVQHIVDPTTDDNQLPHLKMIQRQLGRCVIARDQIRLNEPVVSYNNILFFCPATKTFFYVHNIVVCRKAVAGGPKMYFEFWLFIELWQHRLLGC